MNMKKWGVALSLAATLGLMACGDSSSSDDLSCKVSSDANSVTQTIRKDGQSMETTYTLKDGKAEILIEFSGFSDAEEDEACNESKHSFGGTGSCDNGTYTNTISAPGASIEEMKAEAEESCNEIEAEPAYDDDYEDEEF